MDLPLRMGVLGRLHADTRASTPDDQADCGRIAPAYVLHHHAAETASRTFRECGLSVDWERREAIEISPLL